MERPEEVANGRINFAIVYLETDQDECEWTFYGFAETEDGAQKKQSFAHNKGCKHVRVFSMSEL